MSQMPTARLRIVAVTDPAGQAIAGAPVSPERLHASVWRLLAANALCSMATVTPEGQAHINTAYFAYSDALEVYILSHPQSQHCRNLKANRSLAMTVFPSAQKWGGADRGLQLFGSCAPARGVQRGRAERVYAQRFPGYRDWEQALRPEDPASAYRFYRFLVTRVKVFDEARLGGGVFVDTRVVRP